MFPKFLVLQHKGGEYAGINLAGMKDHLAPIWDILSEAEQHLPRPSTTGNIGLQLHDTKLDRASVVRIVEWLNGVASHIFRLAIIGAGPRQAFHFRRQFKRQGVRLNVLFVYDWEIAKDWLVGEPQSTRS